MASTVKFCLVLLAVANAWRYSHEIVCNRFFSPPLQIVQPGKGHDEFLVADAGIAALEVTTTATAQ